MFYKTFVKPLLFNKTADEAHELTVRFAHAASRSAPLKMLGRAIYGYRSPILSQNIWGLDFSNPVGLAAGFDKNGLLPEIIEASGFGFIEVGSVTAKPSTGNPLPRAFRLSEDRSLINRMGLNNDGAQTVVKRLRQTSHQIPLGINIAKTNDPSLTGDRAINDYLESYREAVKIADYITVNISCPNTEEGKTFEDPAILDELLSALEIKKDARIPPTLVKFSADTGHSLLDQLINVCEDHKIDGYVAANTSSLRDGLKTSQEDLRHIGRGGLSGRAIRQKSTQVIRWIHEITRGGKPIIGVGGIDSAESALEKLKAGADLLQVYTGLIYEGPALVKRINRGLDAYIRRKGYESILQIHSEPVETA